MAPCARLSARAGASSARASIAVPAVPRRQRAGRRRGGEHGDDAVPPFCVAPPLSPCRASIHARAINQHQRQQQQPLFLLLRRPSPGGHVAGSRRTTLAASSGAGAAPLLPPSGSGGNDPTTTQQPFLRPPSSSNLTPIPTTPLARLLAFASDLLRALWQFLRASAALLPQFSRPSPAEALRRLGLVLAASAFMVAAVSAIDGAWLTLYLMRAAAGGRGGVA